MKRLIASSFRVRLLVSVDRISSSPVNAYCSFFMALDIWRVPARSLAADICFVILVKGVCDGAVAPELCYCPLLFLRVPLKCKCVLPVIFEWLAFDRGH